MSYSDLRGDGEIFSDRYIANFMENVPLKEF